MSNTIPTPTTLMYDLATDLLHTAEQTLLDNNLTLPSHRYVSWHEPAWDCCDHLVVHFKTVQLARGLRRTRASAHKDGPPLTILDTDIILTYIGCAATGDPIPSDSVIDANSKSMYTNAWTVYQGMICFFVPQSINVRTGACTLIEILPLTANPPQGGCEAFTCGVTVQLS
jgi:hypothetical protein